MKTLGSYYRRPERRKNFHALEESMKLLALMLSCACMSVFLYVVDSDETAMLPAIATIGATFATLSVVTGLHLLRVFD